MEIHLLRHGQTGWNVSRRVQGHSDSRLTDTGVQQAKELGRRISGIGFDRVYCSSSLRARQTARYVFGRDADIQYLDSLREIFLGPWEGRLYKEVEGLEPESFRHFWHEPHKFNVTGAETFYDLQRRAVQAVQDIYQRQGGGTVALVSHGAWIKTVLAHFQHLDMSELWSPPLMHNCSHSIIRLNDDGSGDVLQHADEPTRHSRDSGNPEK